MARHLAAKAGPWRRATSVALTIAAAAVLGVAACDADSGSAPTGESEPLPPELPHPAVCRRPHQRSRHLRPRKNPLLSNATVQPCADLPNLLPVRWSSRLRRISLMSWPNMPGRPRTGSHRAPTGWVAESMTRSRPTPATRLSGLPVQSSMVGHKNRYAFGGNAADVTIIPDRAELRFPRRQQQRRRREPRLGRALDGRHEHHPEECRRRRDARLG